MSVAAIAMMYATQAALESKGPGPPDMLTLIKTRIVPAIAPMVATTTHRYARFRIRLSTTTGRSIASCCSRNHVRRACASDRSGPRKARDHSVVAVAQSSRLAAASPRPRLEALAVSTISTSYLIHPFYSCV